MKATPTTRIFRTTDEIVAEVTRTSIVRVDWAYLLRIHFREDSVAKFSAWAASEGLQWKLEEYDRGGLEKGHTVVLTARGVNQRSVEEGLAVIASRRASAKEVKPGAPGRRRGGSKASCASAPGRGRS